MPISYRVIKRQLAIVGGNILEWYDYSLYGLVGTIIAKLYFPAQNYINSLILMFGVFALCNIIKPLGGFVLGRLGDRYGVKRMLTVTMLGVSISTLRGQVLT